MRILNRATRLTLAAGVVLAGSLAVAGPANADAQASSPIGACGGSYHEIDHHDIPGARIHLLYNGTTNCVVTWKNNPGTASRLFASIAKQNADGNFTNYIHDDGNFTTYAGPVKVNAAGTCIDWGGGTSSYTWMSGRSHCG
ncbi:hypothetical protein IU448_21155 [Nocardia flavorosea]|uniref:hypothetical protein n=1 Tax=Nocardia flavorosea TaxID=53429 RepID=UPI0018947CB6|nr:hypothetical protein [Nocardia flavorosea]MBF6351499.1 hypothetical protein [Nocardia flavorosea]